MKRKAIMDDGCDPELVAGARFDGLFDIPVIEKPEQIVIPSSIVPFLNETNSQTTILPLAFTRWISDFLKYLFHQRNLLTISGDLKPLFHLIVLCIEMLH